MSDGQSERQARGEARRREVLQFPTVAASHHVWLDPPRVGDQLVTASPGPDGDIYALWSADDGDELASRTIQPDWASVLDPQTAETVAAIVTAHAPERRIVATLPRPEHAYPIVQPLPDGRVLLAGGRAAWRPNGPDKNAIVVDADGGRLVEATLGDGIADIQTTTSGDVWVSYFDEGVYGNFGWNGPGPAPIGQSGIARFDSDLELQWEFPSHVDSPWGCVDDCYAFNVVDDVAWSCYYSDFPIVRIKGGEITSWRNPVAGAHALAVGGNDRILLVGGYGPERDRLIEGRLSDGELRVISESRLTLSNGEELPPHTLASGRGPDLFVVTGRDCYRLSADRNGH